MFELVHTYQPSPSCTCNDPEYYNTSVIAIHERLIAFTGWREMSVMKMLNVRFPMASLYFYKKGGKMKLSFYVFASFMFVSF